MAQHDILTDLPNRLLFEEIANKSLAIAERNNTKDAAMFIDIDGFKAINDTLGHQSGDQLLQMIASRIKERIRATDTVARLGGDEFIVLLANVQDRPAVTQIAADIVECVSKPFDLDIGVGRVGASIGIAMFPEDARSVKALVQVSDAAMYKVKKSGKNGYQFASNNT